MGTSSFLKKSWRTPGCDTELTTIRQGDRASSSDETGQRRIEVAELVALAYVMKKGPKDIAALFVPPTAAEWAKVIELHKTDARFRSPPEVGRLKTGGAKESALAPSRRKKAPRGRSKNVGDSSR